MSARARGQFGDPPKLLAAILLIGIIIFLLLFIARSPSMDASDRITDLIGESGQQASDTISDTDVSESSGDGLFSGGQDATQDQQETGDSPAPGAGRPPSSVSAGEIGGGQPYVEQFPDQTHCQPPPRAPVVRSRDHLEEALQQAGEGAVVYIAPDAEIDAGGGGIEVPGGVTLASNRGCNGAEGGLIYRDSVGNRQILRITGENATINGVRIRGHCTDWPDYPGTPNGCDKSAVGIRADGNGFEFTNSMMTHAYGRCILLRDADRTNVHHSIISHCMVPGAPGYGVDLVHAADVRIEYNYFDHIRHAIAGNGDTSQNSYIARFNIVGEHVQNSQFEMHGHSCADGTSFCGTAGDYVVITYNTFRYGGDMKTYTGVGQQNIHIRGTPATMSNISFNWVGRPEGRAIAQATGADSRIYAPSSDFNNLWVRHNHHGLSEPPTCNIGAPREGCGTAGE